MQKNQSDLMSSAQEPILFTDNCCACLLYTSDAADERSGVDLGGRRVV